MQMFTQICCVFYSNLVKYLLKSYILFTQNLFFYSVVKNTRKSAPTCYLPVSGNPDSPMGDWMYQ